MKKVIKKVNIIRDLSGTGSDLGIEEFAQKIAQEEDAGTKAINDKYGVPTKEDFDFKIFNDGTGKPTEIVKKELSTSEVLRQGFEEEQAQDAYHKQYDEYVTAQRDLAAAKIPEYSDPNKTDQFKTNMRTTLRSYGFNDGEIGSLADHRMLMVIRDAMSYKSVKDKRPIAQKKVANAPRVVKSGIAKSSASSGREGIRNKIGRLKKTGHLKDAQNALLDMINLKSQQTRK